MIKTMESIPRSKYLDKILRYDGKAPHWEKGILQGSIVQPFIKSLSHGSDRIDYIFHPVLDTVLSADQKPAELYGQKPERRAFI